MRTIAVVSGKGGSGKSCVAAYTGLALARAGKRTLLTELGCDCRSADVILGLSDTALFSLRDALAGDCPVASAIAVSALHENLSVLPCALTQTAPPVGETEFNAILNGLPDTFDYLILDGVDISVFPVSQAGIFINVATPEWLSVRAASELTRRLYSLGAGEVRLVINKVPPRVMPLGKLEDFDDVIDFTGARLLAVIPDSPKLCFASNNTEDVDADSIVPKIFGALATRLEGGDVPLLIQ